MAGVDEDEFLDSIIANDAYEWWPVKKRGLMRIMADVYVPSWKADILLQSGKWIDFKRRLKDRIHIDAHKWIPKKTFIQLPTKYGHQCRHTVDVPPNRTSEDEDADVVILHMLPGPEIQADDQPVVEIEANLPDVAPIAALQEVAPAALVQEEDPLGVTQADPSAASQSGVSSLSTLSAIVRPTALENLITLAGDIAVSMEGLAADVSSTTTPSTSAAVTDSAETKDNASSAVVKCGHEPSAFGEAMVGLAADVLSTPSTSAAVTDSAQSKDNASSAVVKCGDKLSAFGEAMVGLAADVSLTATPSTSGAVTDSAESKDNVSRDEPGKSVSEKRRGKRRLDDVEEDEEKLCPICLDTFSAEATIKTLPCNHEFHRECLLTWVRQGDGNGDCPLCRQCILCDGRRCEVRLHFYDEEDDAYRPLYHLGQ